MAHSSPFHGLNTLIETYGMIPPGSTVLCACSGGADSVYLLHRLYLLRERMGFRLAAAHYNHQLRGEESRAGRSFVRRFVAQWCGPAQVDGHELPGLPSMWAGASRGLPRAESWDEAWRRPPGRCVTPSSGRPRQSWAEP